MVSDKTAPTDRRPSSGVRGLWSVVGRLSSVMPTPRLLGLSLGVPALLLLATFEPRALALVPLYLAAVGGVVALDLWLAPGSRAFTIERHHEPRLSLGEPNPVEVRVRRVGPRRTGDGRGEACVAP